MITTTQKVIHLGYTESIDEWVFNWGSSLPGLGRF